MRKFLFAKLVRDTIVEHIIAEGNTPQWKTLTDSEFIEELKKKIGEEAAELSMVHRDDIVNELADIQEIIDTLLSALHITKKQLTEIQQTKNKQVGSFSKKQYIEHVLVNNNSTWIAYYQANHEKYPEIT